MSENPCFTEFSGGRPLNLGGETATPPKFWGYGLTGYLSRCSGGLFPQCSGGSPGGVHLWEGLVSQETCGEPLDCSKNLLGKSQGSFWGSSGMFQDCNRRALDRVTKQKHRPNRQKLSKKCPKIVFSAPLDNFRTFFGHFFDIFRTFCRHSHSLGCPTTCPLQFQEVQVRAKIPERRKLTN